MAKDKYVIHKGERDFAVGIAFCKYIVIHGNQSYYWRDVTCKRCLKIKHGK